MSLTIVAQKNHLGTTTTPFLVHTAWRETIEYEKLVDIMAEGRTTLTKPDIAGCLELFVEEIAKLAAEGRYVKTPLGAFYLCASGKLESVDQAFTPKSQGGEHEIRLHFRPDRGYEEKIRARTTVVREEILDRKAPMVISVLAVKGKEGLKAAAGDYLRIKGQRLKFDEADPELGLFFVNGSTTRSQAYAEILPGSLIAEVPPGLAPGAYILTLRTRNGGEEIHEGKLALPFLVE